MRNQSIRTPLGRVIGLGSAKDGTEHWWAQRLTALGLVFLTPLFVVPFAGALGTGYEAVRSLYAHPFHALVAMLFIGVACAHLKQGLQVVIEDYVSNPSCRTIGLIANGFYCWLLAAAGIFSVLKIAFGG